MAPHRSIFRPSYQVIVAALALAAVLTVSFAYDQWTGYRDAIAHAERDTKAAAGILAEHMARTFDAAEETLRAVARVRRDVEEGRIPYDSGAIHSILKVVHAGSPVFRAIGWMDAKGDRIASSLFRDPPPLNVAGDEQFVAMRDAPPGARDLHVAAPVHSRILDNWIISMSLRVEKPDGSFDGIVSGAVDPSYFAGVYRGVDLGESQVITLFRRDGTILVREPVDNNLLGRSLAGRPFVTDRLAGPPRGTFQGFGLSDGDKRIVSYAHVPGTNLAVTVAVAEANVLARFRSSLATDGARLALMLAALTLGTWLLVRQMRRHDRLAVNLRDSETKSRDFAASGGDWFWETDAQHRFVWMSDSVQAATGLPPSWHYGKSRRDLAAPDGVSAETWAEHRRILSEHLPFRDFEYIRRGPTGDRWLRSSGVPIFGEDGRFRGYRGSGRDVTELRRAEQRLREAVEAIPGRFLLFDADDRLIYANRSNAADPPGADLAHIGETFETILRNTVRAGHIPEATADSEAWITERLRRHRAAAGRTLVRRGDRMLEVIERPTHDGGIMMLRFDVTEREHLAEAQRQAREAADAANRAKSEFLSRMSHELRTPLNAILGFAQVLQIDRSGDLTGRQKEYIEFIVNGGEHLLNLVNEVLDLAGVEAGRMKLSLERIDLAEILTLSVETMRPVARKSGIALTLAATGTHVDVRADAQRLRQVLLNLLSNAIKYNRPEGSVSVSASLTADDRVRIAVADTGIGITAEHAGQLFEPFNRLGAEHTSIEGTGIGLALSKRLVEAMDGTIGHTSEPGRGSTFWIELPLSAPAALPGAAATLGSTAPLAAAGGYRLLYVEDNTASLRLMQHLVGALPNVAMLSAPDGRLGLDLAAAHRPDVIVLDLNLPGMSGYEILRRLNAMPETCDVPVIALSAAAMPSDIKRGMAAGFFRYLTKPLEVNAFLAAVDEALATRRQRAANDG